MISLLKKTALKWYKNDPFSQSASVAYYAIFSLPALTFLYLSIASLISQKKEVLNQVELYLINTVGEQATNNILKVIDYAGPNDDNRIFFVLAILIILFISLRIFLQLQKSLNYIWGIPQKKNISWKRFFLRHYISFLVMLFFGLIPLLAFFVTTIFSIMLHWLADHISQELLDLLTITNFVFSFLMITILFSLMIKFLPDKKIKWSQALKGSFIGAILFMIGQFGLSLYFDLVQPQSLYGYTGSIVVLMLWISYSCAMFFFGAEFTKCLQEQGGRR